MDNPRSCCILLSRPVFVLLLMVLIFAHGTSAVTIQLTKSNFKNIISTHELVFVNFYADLCRFSHTLAPVFDETEQKIKQMFPEPGKVAFGKLECNSQHSIATQFNIKKYPTLKLFRYGQPVRKEYRGQRSVDALIEFIQSQMKEVIKHHMNMDVLDELEDSNYNIIGFFDDKETDAYKTFRHVSSQLRDECVFHTAVGEISSAERGGTSAKIFFRPPHSRREDIVYSGDVTNYKFMLQWVHDKCWPLVKEIKFENAEEFTEEGLPFLILFHSMEDRDIVKKFHRVVHSQLLHEKENINFLTADGMHFAHPLQNLGKTVHDLPLLAIDTFKHMFLFKHDLRTELEAPGLLKQFVADLHSGKLHDEFHNPPPTAPSPPKVDAGITRNVDQTPPSHGATVTKQLANTPADVNQGQQVVDNHYQQVSSDAEQEVVGNQAQPESGNQEQRHLQLMETTSMSPSSPPKLMVIFPTNLVRQVTSNLAHHCLHFGGCCLLGIDIPSYI